MVQRIVWHPTVPVSRTLILHSSIELPEICNKNNVTRKKRVLDNIDLPASASTSNITTFGSSTERRTSSCTLPWSTSIVMSYVCFSAGSSSNTRANVVFVPYSIINPAKYIAIFRSVSSAAIAHLTNPASKGTCRVAAHELQTIYSREMFCFIVTVFFYAQ